MMFQEPLPPEESPSKFGMVFEVLGQLATGVSNAFNVPTYLAWGLIILIISWLLYFAFVFIDGILRIIRYALLFISLVWLIGFLFALQLFAL